MGLHLRVNLFDREGNFVEAKFSSNKPIKLKQIAESFMKWDGMPGSHGGAIGEHVVDVEDTPIRESDRKVNGFELIPAINATNSVTKIAKNAIGAKESRG